MVSSQCYYHLLWLVSFFWHRCLLLASAAFLKKSQLPFALWFCISMTYISLPPSFGGLSTISPGKRRKRTCPDGPVNMWHLLLGASIAGVWGLRRLPPAWKMGTLLPVSFLFFKNDHMPSVLIIFLAMSRIQILLLLLGKPQTDQHTNLIPCKKFIWKLKKNYN